MFMGAETGSNSVSKPYPLANKAEVMFNSSSP